MTRVSRRARCRATSEVASRSSWPCCIVPLMLLAAFTVDLGIAYAQAQAFAAGSDSAALAIAGAKRANLNAHASAPGNCQSLIASDAGQALAIAKKQADANRPYDLKATTGQVDVQVTLTCVNGTTGAPDANGILRVRVTVQRDVPDDARPARRRQHGQGLTTGQRRAGCQRDREGWGLPARHL